MYIETSSPRKQGQKAQLATPSYTDNTDVCVTFWYHMYGNGIGTLNVYAMVSHFIDIVNFMSLYLASVNSLLHNDAF